ncbi:hypothetical protein LTR56_025372 [Elasticomyces elasticus]|nr:hypothetical protein LTR56_025372 [Elasticomyces elasticus]KAK3620933.1 hypothetical protein LTR22_025411 [Elasticomyces elasticus]KAK4917571.1 hypothetical protein LTR49_014525 [Elasticomyces elasticus]KAK5762791.1 hypothetical protein LTS12_006980 [Elasticomyces elasticus]
MAKRKRAKNSSGGSSRKKAKATAPPVVSRLMSLPPELRNSIYEYVLLEPDDIDVDTNLLPPALIQVSPQIKAEASGIWYAQNQFHNDIIDCNIEVAMKWRWHILRLGMPTSNGTSAILPSPNWTNLLRWCQYVCASGQAIRLNLEDDLNPEEAVVEAAHAIAYEHCYDNRTWEECKLVLEPLRRIAGIVDNRWLL